MGMTAVAFDLEQLDLVEPPQRMGGYLVLDRIAEGGMALIFRGRDLGSGELVALKTVRTGEPHEVEGLNREIATLRRLRHPGIVRLVADGRSEGLPWMALELLEGKTLFDRMVSIWSDLSSHGKIPSAPQAPRYPAWIQAIEGDEVLAPPEWLPAAGRLRDALLPIVGLAPVLDHIHDRGFVHRDLTPGNIFLGRDGRTTLLDFGLAGRSNGRDAEPRTTRSCHATVEYAAPEQLCGQRVDARSDIYALGSILYELVTGRLPFDGDSPQEMARNHLDRDPVCPSDLVCGLSWQLEDLILAMLARDPACRPRRAGAVATSLLEILQTMPTRASAVAATAATA